MDLNFTATKTKLRDYNNLYEVNIVPPDQPFILMRRPRTFEIDEYEYSSDDSDWNVVHVLIYYKLRSYLI